MLGMGYNVCMCGINGIALSKQNVTTSSSDMVGMVERMNTILSHRGPDYAGTWQDRTVVFGHTLLSIRDAATVSGQPYVRKGSPWVLAFNGQLYNTAAMKRELGASAANIDLDTELLYRLIEKHGWQFTQYIEGMYAIALYHIQEGVVRLYRDGAGQKGLYYRHLPNDEGIMWSSEIKALYDNDILPLTLSLDALEVATTIGYIPGGATLFQGVYKLNPGEVLTYNTRTHTITTNPLETAHTQHEAYFPSSLDEAFDMLIAEHLQSKQKVAINLSGGLDSSLLVHEMKKRQNDIHTYTTSFTDAPESLNRDAVLARRLATDYGTHHTDISIGRKEYMDALEIAYATIEEPNYNISLPVYYLTARHEGIHGDGNRVILSGDGGDEVFGGYGYYKENIVIDAKMRRLTPWGYNALKTYREGVHIDFTDPVERWLYFKRFREHYYVPSSTQAKEMAHIHGKGAVGTYLKKAAEHHVFSAKKSIYNSMLLDRVLWMGGENFIRSDKLYMSQSLELRAPLSYMPWRRYIDGLLTDKDYFDEAGNNKVFLRRHYKGKLPDYIVERADKTGWRSPIETWFNADIAETFAQLFEAAAVKGTHIRWADAAAEVRAAGRAGTWPGKHIMLYVSLACLSKKFGVSM
jgi:asparagine synthase (glutamine-hydrolysing)